MTTHQLPPTTVIPRALADTAAAAARIRTALDRIEALWDASLYPDKVISAGRAAVSEGSRPPVPIGGVSLRAEIAQRLHYWADLAITHAGALPRLQRLSNLSAIAAMRWYADWLAQDHEDTGRDGHYLADELEDYAHKLAAHTLPKQPTADNAIGACPLGDGGTLMKAGDLLECTECGKRAETWRWWERRFPDLQADVTQQQVADNYGVPVATVKTWVRRYGIPAVTPPKTRPVLYRWAQVRWLVEYRNTRVA